MGSFSDYRSECRHVSGLCNCNHIHGKRLCCASNCPEYNKEKKGKGEKE